MKTEKIDQLFYDFYKESPSPVELPEGLDDRLNRFIDDLDEKEKPRLSGRKIWLRITSVAACTILVLSGMYFYNRKSVEDDLSSLRPTIEDPYEAYLEVEKAFEMIAENFTKGLNMTAQIELELRKTNQIIHETSINLWQTKEK